ncbi:helix-turn-helix domain-containing protein [Curtobacterium sp. NPDC090217]|uniref:AraC family transcriptional regulator n=1 Tax=Curtobacterium sp. NPDC090217 TaxID=3363970 RepID=UPI003814F0CB
MPTRGVAIGRLMDQMIRIEIAARDPESAIRELAAVDVGRQWSSRRTGDEYSFRYSAVGDDEVTIRRSRIRGLLRGLVPPGDDHVVRWTTDGSVVIDAAGARFELRHDEPVLSPSDREYVFVGTDHDQRLVHLGRAFVEIVAAERYGAASGPLVFDRVRVVDDAALGPWREALGALSRALRDGVESDAWVSAKHAAAEAFLTMFPPRLDALPAELSSPRNARLKSVVEYLHAHVRDSIAVADLADVAGLSVRSVQESFARVLGVSPLTYLREIRLDRVRDDLLALDPQSVTVGDVARRWGFAHLGRFSAAYVDRFGEYPKQTLRR